MTTYSTVQQVIEYHSALRTRKQQEENKMSNISKIDNRQLFLKETITKYVVPSHKMQTEAANVQAKTR